MPNGADTYDKRKDNDKKNSTRMAFRFYC